MSPQMRSRTYVRGPPAVHVNVGVNEVVHPEPLAFAGPEVGGRHAAVGEQEHDGKRPQVVVNPALVEPL